MLRGDTKIIRPFGGTEIMRLRIKRLAILKQ